jgi:hypothetical protein
MTSINGDLLGTYLNDHLAGSAGALELIGRMAEREAGTPLGEFLAGLEREIQDDQATLQDLLARLGVGEGTVKKAAAWLAEKASRLKLAGSGGAADLGRFEELEALALGIQGKLALWGALEAVAHGGGDARLAGLDFARLKARARAQHDAVERHRIEAARAAFTRP